MTMDEDQRLRAQLKDGITMMLNNVKRNAHFLIDKTPLNIIPEDPSKLLIDVIWNLHSLSIKEMYKKELERFQFQ